MAWNPSSDVKIHRYKRSLHSTRNNRWSFFDFLFGRRNTSGHSKVFLGKDYMRKTFVNPYFHKSLILQRTKAKKTKIFLFAIAILSILAIFLYHPFFDIHSLVIKGNQKISNKNIQIIIKPLLEQRTLLIFKQKNFFTLDAERITEELKKHYAFERLTVSKYPFSTLIIDVLERAPAFVIKSGENFYYADKNGIYLGPADVAEFANSNFLNRLPQIWLISEKQFTLNDQIISPATMQFIITLFKTIPDRAGLALQGVIPQDEEGRLLHVVTSEGWQIYVDRQNDWEKQVTILKNILNIKFKDKNRAGLQYIDVRYENRVYIK